MQRFLFVYAMITAADALASNKPPQGSKHAKALMVERGRLEPDHNSSGQLDHVAGFRHWGGCSARQLQGKFTPIRSDRCMNANLVFVRIPKCASTSLSSVLRRVGARYGVSGVDNQDISKARSGLPEPFLWSFHEPLRDVRMMLPSTSLPVVKVTMLREPVARVISQYYYSATHKENIKHESILQFLKSSSVTDNMMFSALRPKDETNVAAVLDQYAFVGVTERFDDSVVLLMEQLGLSYCDVIYNVGKVAEESKTPDGTPFLKPVPFDKQPQEVRDYLESSEFQESQKLDFEAYRYAKERLNKSIAALGREAFDAKLRDFAAWKEDVLAKCDPDSGSWFRENNVVVDRDDPRKFKKWRKQQCYSGDFGCGYKCFDAFCATSPK
jgi:hypothetical protein